MSYGVTKSVLRNQLVFIIDDMILSQHAYERILSRNIRPDEILCTWQSDNTLCRATRDIRSTFYNYEYGLFIIIDNITNIIVTIIEMEWRKYRPGIYNLQKKYGITKPLTPFYPVSPVC